MHSFLCVLDVASEMFPKRGLFGLPAKSGPTYDDVAHLIYDDDRECVATQRYDEELFKTARFDVKKDCYVTFLEPGQQTISCLLCGFVVLTYGDLITHTAKHHAKERRLHIQLQVFVSFFGCFFFFRSRLWSGSRMGSHVFGRFEIRSQANVSEGFECCVDRPRFTRHLQLLVSE